MYLTENSLDTDFAQPLPVLQRVRLGKRQSIGRLGGNHTKEARSIILLNLKKCTHFVDCPGFFIIYNNTHTFLHLAEDYISKKNRVIEVSSFKKPDPTSTN